MISIIIPVLNEESVIGPLIGELRDRQSGYVKEIIVVDGGSEDETVARARKAGARVISDTRRGRSRQMNRGAEEATTGLLYFLHADSIPPPEFDRLILEEYGDQCRAGCFQLAFDSTHPLLNMYAWFTRFDLNAFRFGDQSLFVSRALFFEIGGYRDHLIVMEDNEIVRRLKRHTRFKIIPQKVVTSARKYEEIGAVKLQLIFSLIYVLFHIGYSQELLVSIYQRFIAK